MRLHPSFKANSAHTAISFSQLLAAFMCYKANGSVVYTI